MLVTNAISLWFPTQGLWWYQLSRRHLNGHLREFPGGGRLGELPRDDVGERCSGCLDRVSSCIGVDEDEAACADLLGDEFRGEFDLRGEGLRWCGDVDRETRCAWSCVARGTHGRRPGVPRK